MIGRNKPNYRRAMQAARKTLRECGIGVRPVPVDEIAAHLGLLLQFEVLPDDISGFLFSSGGRTMIGVHSLQAPVRQRFTIAHEIGHFVLDHYDDMHVDKRFVARSELSSLAVDAKEIEANWFAAELLMPTPLLQADLEDLGGLEILDIEDDELIEELAQRYHVSKQAMSHRLAREARER